MSDPVPNHELFEELKRENQALRDQVEQLHKIQKQRRKSLRFLFSKKAAFIIIGKGLKNSLNQLYSELPSGVRRDTFADVSAHLVWRLTRIGVFAVAVSVIPLLILVVQTVILSKQNKLFSNQNELFNLQIQQVDRQNDLISGQNALFKEQNELFANQNVKVEIQNDLVQGQNKLVGSQNNLFETQNDLVKQQNKRIVQQTELIEAGRRSSLVFLMGNIMDKVDEELKRPSNTNRNLSDELIGRISALSQSLKPYRYLKNDRLIKKPLSPERGQLLLALVNSRLDTANAYHKIYTETKFSRADLNEAVLTKAHMSLAKLTKADLSEANLNETNLKRAFLKEADLKEVEALSANFQECELIEADMAWGEFSGANFSRATLTEADLSEADLDNCSFFGAYLKKADLSEADLSEADLRGAYLNRANLSNTQLSGAKVSTDRWFKKLEKWKVKGFESIQQNYRLEQAIDENGEEYFIVREK